MYKAVVVDDEPGVARALTRALSRAGFSVATCFDGEDALRVVETMSPDVVLTDFMMPGMNGIQLLSEVARVSPRTLRILISGVAVMDTEDRTDSLFIPKPWDNQQLAATLIEHLAAWQTRQAEQTNAVPAATSSKNKTPARLPQTAPPSAPKKAGVESDEDTVPQGRPRRGAVARPRSA